ncbi:hypothetical protein AB0H83_48525 [Dactylosporangium sp. NPDC050688]|uniref:hypothetical protein n=1 Tax=Dactylosporangium sp. NPDC050688 TaxID=3157217 RepID=UPI0033E91174
MTSTQTQGGFAGDPAAALDVAGTSGCCGNPPQAAAPTLPDPRQAAPCCGTAAEAAQAGACCGTSAKAEAVASGTGCCG